MFSRFLSIFSTRTPTPPPAGMHPIPCTGLDLTAREVILTTGLMIDARLDAKKLEETLLTLIERKFPRAGARIALRNGVYEFQVPQTFGPGTPPVVFTVDDYPEPYRSASRPDTMPDASRFPASQPTFCAFPEMKEYLRSKSCPESFDAFLAPNTPLLHVHVAVFDDLTFIGATSSHLAFDALGTATLLHAWTRLINGDDIDTIQGMDWDAAPFESFTAPTSVTHQRGWFDLGLFPKILFIIRFVLRLLRDPKQVGYLVRVPKVFLDDSKRDIMEILKLQGSTEWVGREDVLMAWWFKAVFGHRGSGDTTPIHIHFPVNLRDKPVFPGGSTIATPFINNAIMSVAIPPIPANAFGTESLGEIALRIRRGIMAYSADLAGIEADLHWRCANPVKVLFPCSSDGEFAVQTSWRLAKLGELDFFGACVPGRGEKARVVFALPIMTSGNDLPMRGNGAAFIEDDKSIWMSQFLGSKEWEAMRRSGRVLYVE
ncbi:hypothetical protein B0H11DRAFT_1114982 [Mycena galericulata]|nr:hypothetical protein B0H11DRAFT_1114982 [Mycena galericulata]